MSVQVEKLEKGMARLTIEVGAEELEKALESAYQKNKNKISIPGFRKGKVPRKAIEKMYGPEMFYEDAANELIADAYEKALDECGEDIVSAPKVNVVQIEAGKPFIFTAEVALKPEVTLGDYKGIQVEKADTEVTEEEILAEIDLERDKNSTTETITDRPVKEGDETIIDFDGYVDGVAFEGGKGTDYPLTIGSGAFIPGFEVALVGAEIGKEVEVNVTFPEDYHAEELAGKPAVFKCVVKNISEKVLPELDDEFAGEISETANTVEELKAEMKERIAKRKEEEARAAKEDAVIDAIIENATMEIPDAMLETQQRQMVEEFAQRIQMQGLSMEQYMQFTGMTPDRMLDQIKPQALRRIQSRLVLEAVVAAEGITATEEDFEAEVGKMAEAYRMEPDKVKEVLGENGRKQVMDDVCVQKAADLVVEAAVEK